MKMKNTIGSTDPIRQLQGTQKKKMHLLAQSLEYVYFCILSTKSRLMTKPSTLNRVKG